MRIPQIYLAKDLACNEPLELDKLITHRLLNVLRLDLPAKVIFFNNTGYFYESIVTGTKKKLVAHIEKSYLVQNESPLTIHLAQGIAKAEHMDYALQKATELGVTTIIPTITSFGLHLNSSMLAKRMEHWQQVIISAAEQCQRSILPTLIKPHSLAELLPQYHTRCKIIFHPHASENLQQLAPSAEVLVLIGPEGGFSKEELTLSQQYNVKMLSLGPRILRTETAASSAICALQLLWGDLR